MKTSDFDYHLPPELIAQDPLPNRTDARLMVLNRKTQTIRHQHIRDLPQLLTGNDVLVFNQTKVFPARIHGTVSDKKAEILLHRNLTDNEWECLVKPGKRFPLGAVFINGPIQGEVTDINDDGSRQIQFNLNENELHQLLEEYGETPLPPYIKHSQAPAERYQTVYATEKGSVAAPTAGLHFTQELLQTLKKNGVDEQFVTLHVGRGTFEPVKVEDLSQHVMHREYYEVSPTAAKALNEAKQAGKRVIAVGTTSTRTLEAAAETGKIEAKKSHTELFITPGYEFKAIDGLLTNFHLPKSTLLMLISALAGKAFIEQAYKEAVAKKYRFFSYGDAMLIL
jgi:S-adenosylmethionine:tRNA ribosyltransferase-isomerase